MERSAGSAGSQNQRCRHGIVPTVIRKELHRRNVQSADFPIGTEMTREQSISLRLRSCMTCFLNRIKKGVMQTTIRIVNLQGIDTYDEGLVGGGGVIHSNLEPLNPGFWVKKWVWLIPNSNR